MGRSLKSIYVKMHPHSVRHVLRKIEFHFTSKWMGYDRGDGFPFDFEPKTKTIWNPFDFEPKEFHLVQNRKENRHHNHIPFNLNENLVFSVPKKWPSDKKHSVGTRMHFWNQPFKRLLNVRRKSYRVDRT